MITPADFLTFVGAIAPELYELMKNTKGDVRVARSRLHPILAQARQDELAIDRELERQAAKKTEQG